MFLLSDHEATILTTDEVASDPQTHLANVRYATQSGPLLLQGGQINPLFTPGSDNRVVRSAACVTTARDMALVRSHSAINFYDFARQLRDKLGCRDALYLDGSVSQLYPFDNGQLGPSFAAMIGVTMPVKP